VVPGVAVMSVMSGLIERQLECLPRSVVLEWPGGRAGRQGADVTLKFDRPSRLADLARGEVGALADAYVRGEMEICGSMRDLMLVAAQLAGDPVNRSAPLPWERAWKHLRSLWLHSRERDAQQIQFHYDVSDEFYGLWLDPRRVYSCAYYRDAGSMDLAQAQEAKLDHICRKLALQPGQRFLDVGAGWGGLLLWAAEHYGVQATGITLSRNQHAHANRLIGEKGLAGRVQMKLLDYRDLPEGAPYDRIASVGMFEHVGRANLSSYFAKLRSLLVPGGLVLNHGITAGGLHNDGLGSGMGDFIDRYIFPGGELEHVASVSRHVAEGELELLDAENLRPHYARTLWAWSDALESQLPQARRIAGEQTVRAYRLYLAGCAMAFERGWISLYQLLCSRPTGEVGADAGAVMRGAQADYGFNRSYMYA
jgi:cyclopropane-fatty-acyl-phospholipid synthase